MRPRVLEMMRLHWVSILVAVCVLCVVGVSILRLRAQRDAIVRRLIDDPGYDFSKDDLEVISKYLKGKIPVLTERTLIQASMQRVALCGDPYVYALLVGRWKLYGECRDLPSLAWDFLSRRDDAAATIMTYTEDSLRRSLLSERRAKELLSAPASQRFHMGLILSCDPAVLANTMDEFIMLHTNGQMSEKTWDLFERRVREIESASTAPSTPPIDR
jgi:hypothetical protein